MLFIYAIISNVLFLSIIIIIYIFIKLNAESFCIHDFYLNKT